MNLEAAEGQDAQTCPACGAPARAGTAFCGSCGHRLEPDAVTRAEPESKREDGQIPRSDQRRTTLRVALLVLTLLALAALIVGALELRSERIARRSDVADLTKRLAITQQKLTLAEAQSATLAKRLAGLERKFARSTPNVASLAKNALRSVYTVESGQELGTAWVAWRNASGTYLITADHVVGDAVAIGDNQVTLLQKSATYTGTVLRTDETNDLALIRADTSVPGPALWQQPQLDVAPVVGDQLILVGSPYGLEGTVTQGVVSRITYDAIQTDAAANPGNSGGPAIDRDGQVVGILLAGGGENLNFAAPIQRVCVTLRSC